jgi:genome maintenance exonuclease 1
MILDLNRYDYKDYKTEQVLGRRFYDLGDIGLYPSITTVLGHTPTEETKAWLGAWKARVGESEAARKSKLATDRGTNVHLMLERFVRGEDIRKDEFPVEHVRIFNSMKLELTKINAVVGQEMVLYSNTFKVAGRCDMVAEHQGELSIVDYKTSTRIKDAKDIGDYWIQTAFYALAHNEMFGTNIEKLVIMMGVENKLPLVFKKRIDEQMILDLLARTDKFYAELPI